MPRLCPLRLLLQQQRAEVARKSSRHKIWAYCSYRYFSLFSVFICINLRELLLEETLLSNSPPPRLWWMMPSGVMWEGLPRPWKLGGGGEQFLPPPTISINEISSSGCLWRLPDGNTALGIVHCLMISLPSEKWEMFRL